MTKKEALQLFEEKKIRSVWDEDEEIEHNYYKIGKNEFLVNGDLELDDMLALFDLDEDYIDSDSITVGGYILENAGSIPNKRESVEAGGFRFTIMEVANQRIIRVVVKRLVDENTSEEQATDEKEKEE